MKIKKGIYPALITPFTSENKINEKALRQIIQMNIEKGVHGFYVGGSTAEAFLLSLEERKQILEITMAETQGKCQVISHVGCISTDDAVNLARHATSLGVDALSSIPPFYYGFSFEEIKAYYDAIIEATDMPMIVYNFPKLSGVDLNEERVGALCENKKIIGVKHTSMDLFQIERMKTINPDLLVLNGHDEVFLGGLTMGADGAVGSTYNFMAEKFIKIRKLYKKGSIGEAQLIQKDANDIINILIKVGVLPSIKAVLTMMGIDCGDCRSPFKKVTEEEKELLRKTLKL